MRSHSEPRLSAEDNRRAEDEEATTMSGTAVSDFVTSAEQYTGKGYEGFLEYSEVGHVKTPSSYKAKFKDPGLGHRVFPREKAIEQLIYEDLKAGEWTKTDYDTD